MTTDTAERQTSLPIAAAPVESRLVISEDVALAVEASEGTLKAAQVRVLQATICSKLTVPQLQLYVTICARKGVDPFTEAYGFPNPDGGIAFGLRIDGMQALAARTGELLSVKVETLTHDNADGTKGLVGARCTIERDGMSEPVVEEAYMAEYDRGDMGWKQFPETMIRKVARAKCLRVAFADALSGVYEPAEVADERSP